VIGPGAFCVTGADVLAFGAGFAVEVVAELPVEHAATTSVIPKRPTTDVTVWFFLDVA